MRKVSNLAMACLGAIAMLTFSGATLAESVTVNVANGKNIFENGKPDDGVAACNSCHGETAMGMDAMGSPRLSHLGYVYVVKQLTDFADDKRNPEGLGAVMNGFAKALSAQERRDVSAYVNTIARTNEPSDLAALKDEGQAVGEAYKGKIIVQYGKAGKVSACVSCHGFNGRGADPVYPKIGEQKYVYLVNQLNNWRDGSRTNDEMGQMQAIAKQLSDEDIINAAAYLSQAAESTLGNGMVVHNQSVLSKITGHK
ncbi:MAG: c-type cytochrome [Gallionellaceae bacterium]